jgi:potassium efflux system protein
MLLFVFSVSFGEASRYADSVGRTAFILAHAWVTFVFWRVLRSAGEASSPSGESASRFLRLWISSRYPLLLGTPLALIAVACIGYLITAVDLSYGLFISFGIMAGGQVLLRMAARWFEIRRRRLALAEAIEKRRARSATAEASEQDTDELLQLDEEEELGLDLNVAGDQTVAFLRLLFNLGILLALYDYWSSAVPLAATLDAIPLPFVEELSVLLLVKTLIVVIVTVVAVRNLPGLLEVSLLRTSTIEAGTRKAIYTLCQYGVIGLAIVAVTVILKLDWAQFGWMAAALSVGLGFGLQEVVANFVCGLILLFERPIRVGDVVTIEGTTGTVSNINMRATTITNWDRQDLVVPNKTLITGNILNWTLSEALNRIVIPVGVAYGTDTDEARQILLNVAADNPEVLDEPKPFATFEQFADSSMNLILRAYLPNLDNRVGTITALHAEIARRFAEAGIKIPFPQQELHIRDPSDSQQEGRGEVAEREPFKQR